MIVIYILWCGLAWVLRGGLFNKLQMALTGKKVGTDAGRFVAATLMTAPLLFIDLRLALLWPFIVTATKLGYFDKAMGLEQPWRDHFFLALWGVVVAAVATVPLYITPTLFTGPPTLTLVIAPPYWAAIGALAMVAYAVNKPFGRKFNTDWTERAEFFTGCAMGAAIWSAVNYG
jgi:hypothetical protein